MAADFIVSNIMNWYATRHDDYASPIIKGVPRSNPKERARTRILDDDELRVIWKTAEGNGEFGTLVRLLLLTGQRGEKVSSMRYLSGSMPKKLSTTDFLKTPHAGIEPKRATSVLGYIETEAANSPELPVTRFVEKPSIELAAQLLDSGRCYWNSGIFLFQLSVMLDLMQQHAPEILSPVAKQWSTRLWI